MLAETLDLKANPDRLAAGIVIEARQVVGQGAVATALVQKGTLRVADIVVAGSQWGRVKALTNANGDRMEVRRRQSLAARRTRVARPLIPCRPAKAVRCPAPPAAQLQRLCLPALDVPTSGLPRR